MIVRVLNAVYKAIKTQLVREKPMPFQPRDHSNKAHHKIFISSEELLADTVDNVSGSDEDELVEFQISDPFEYELKTKVSEGQRDNDYDFSSFRVTYGNPKTSKNKKVATWINPGERVQVGPYQISGGFFYLGGRIKTSQGYETDASLIDESYRIKQTDRNHPEDDLGYWPAYSQLSDRQRGTYLHWLSGQRNDPYIPIGYVFIYFYGIERRLLIDFAEEVISDEDCASLCHEVMRLRALYSENRSFDHYSRKLLEYMGMIAPQVFSFIESDTEASIDSMAFKYRLATLVDAGEPIPAPLALTWLKGSQDYRLRTPARRCSEEFERLFLQRYVDKFGDGIVVKPNKTKLKLDYRPASPSLLGLKKEVKLDLPDPSVLTAPVKKCIQIAESCTNELADYSRYIGRKGNHKDDLAGLILLPDDLFKTLSHSASDKFKHWALNTLNEKKGLTSVRKFWACIGLPLPQKINKKEAVFIANVAEKFGFGVAPDERYHHAKPSLEGNMVLFSEGHGNHFKPSRAFNQIGMTLRLGAMVATIDNHVDDAELLMLQHLIQNDLKLTYTEKKSLQAYLIWRLNTPTNMAGLKARIEKLGREEKSVISHLLIGVALADGTVDPSEIKQLEKLYTALGLDKTLVLSDLHTRTSSKTGIIKPSSETTKQSIVSDNQSRHEFSLDEELLQLHESETHDIQNILGEIFTEDEAEVEEQPKTEFNYDEQVTLNDGLDDKHTRLYTDLLRQDEWDRTEVQVLCDKYGLMIDGAIETINDWAYELVDAPVIEEDGHIFLDREIIEELEDLT